MKKLTERAHQTNHDLTDANAEYSTSFIFENDCTQQYVVPNLPVTCWVWEIRLGNHLDEKTWFL